MSKLLDRFRYFKQKGDTFADGHGQVMHTNRDWEDSYRQRWQFDKIVRSTHGVNCTGSCSWKIYVKNGLVTWETQQTDYPRTRPDLPNHEPRGCPRGASYSWYLYSANRLKYPLVRKRLIELWREALSRHSDPVLAWESIMNDPQKCQSYKQVRGHGGFIRSNWKELNQLIAAANVWTIKTYGPDRVAGFSPIPAMSMVSYAAGTRYLSLLGGTCLSFYDWYCDLPPASPMTWGEQTDVPESADWYNSAYIIAWGSNVPQTRTPDAHFFTEVRYKGTKTIAITPDYSEVAKLCDQWLAPKQGTDSALAMAMGHVILKEFHLDNPSDYFLNYCRRYTDMPMLVLLDERADGSHDGPAKGRPRIDTALDASEVILALAPETNGQVAVKAWQALGEMTGREHTHLAINKEDEKIRFRDIQAQPRKIISSPTWSGLESEHVSYNAGYTNVHELIPWRTLSGRQQLYQDHAWMRAFGESLVAYRPPIDTRSVSEMREIPPNGFPEKALNFLTPHQKWGIHSTYSENLLMLTLSRGGPIVWISEADARELGIEDNDWIEAFNANGALTARAVVSQRVPPGMTMMYHAQERIMNIPGSEVTGMRGGIHNSVTRVCPKPTHMIGGYAQLAYGFNYYGTVGSNRDEFIMIRKMKNINWLDDEGRDQVQEAKK
ncbi:nitrate reductase subunit alpha [Salmonella enterica subsp. enterica serovar Adelaide]|nr:nitrate reductase subunit alpha [Salmonella enterica subsp. enterica serovar Adelaide]